MPSTDVGAVEGDDQRPRPGQARAPSRQAVVGVHQVEALAAQESPQPPGGGDVLAAAGGEAEDVDLDPAPAHLVDLVAHPAPALRRRVVGLEVGDDQDAHPGQGIRASRAGGKPGSAFWLTGVANLWHSGLDRCAFAAEHWPPTERGRLSMFYAVMGYLHAVSERRMRRIRMPGGEAGQGTVEYVGLILLVSLLMVGMVAAMKGFNGKQGTELADVIVNKIKEAVDKVAFK